MVLTEKQNEVFDKIKIFIDSAPPVFILRGYAGTGKYSINMENRLYILCKMAICNCKEHQKVKHFNNYI